MKTQSELSIIKHVLLGWIATPVVLVLGSILLLSLVGAEQTEINAFALIALLVGLVTGWFGGLVVYFINWGIRGWVKIGKNVRQNFAQDAEGMEAYAEDAAQADRLALAQQSLAESGHEYAAPVPHEDPAPAPHEDPWNGTNPYGCCQDNFDENGVLHHGSPDCEHPQVLAGRS